MTDSRQELQEIKTLLSQNREVIKPNFGVIFWQLSVLEGQMSPDEFAAQGMNLKLNTDGDEIIAEFTATFVKLWQNAGDLTAASRFVAHCLEMSADELLQTRQIVMDAQQTKD